MKQITVTISLWVPDEATEGDALDWIEAVLCDHPDVIELDNVPIVSTDLH